MKITTKFLLTIFFLAYHLASSQSYFKKIKDPDIFQGAHQTSKYFEGWYFKNISADTSQSWAIIPGIAYNKNGNGKAFIQLINGKNAKTIYLEFPKNKFISSKDSFQVSIENNTFNKYGLHLDIHQDNHSISGDLSYSNHIFFPTNTLLSANVMGPFAFIPMQCKHGILSMNHTVNGQLTIDGIQYNFMNGKGYIEKDWGHSFPNRYVWFQSNNFSTESTSLSVSIASIPHLGFSFTGLLAVLYHDGKFYQFYTYNHSKIKTLVVSENTIEVELKRRKRRLVITANKNKSGLLQAPSLGNMDRKIAESIDAKIQFKLYLGNKLIAEDIGNSGGLEIVNMFNK
jgi:hypothetical protein